ncbi:YkvA family protein [Cytobacillus sp. FJAT-53684]|uniref:YkvA family protein n=1 Tax=Cytobacillus mangrovibacter TaxID=3299024 RepID=A0ABW6K176_9BACI
MPNTNEHEKGYKLFESKAKKYADNPKETVGLLKKSAQKAKKNKTSLSGVWEKFQLLMELVKSWSNGEYRDISKKTIVFMIASILYFVSPIDVIPDFLIGIGIVDDAAVITFALKQLSGELDKFKAWKLKQPIQAE